MNAAEEQRAALYRTEQANRARAQAARCAALHGSAEAHAALVANWLPVTRLQPELPDIDYCLTDGCRPFGPQTN